MTKQVFLEKLNLATKNLVYTAYKSIISDKKAGKKFEIEKYAKLFDSVFSVVPKNQFDGDSLYSNKEIDRKLTTLFVKDNILAHPVSNQDIIEASKTITNEQEQKNFLFLAALLNAGVDFIEKEQTFLSENSLIFQNPDEIIYFFNASFGDRVRCRINRIKMYIASERTCSKHGHNGGTHIKGGVVGAFFKGLFEGGNLCNEDNIN